MDKEAQQILAMGLGLMLLCLGIGGCMNLGSRLSEVDRGSLSDDCKESK